MKTPHKHKDLIIAWANGAEIECGSSIAGWGYCTPEWDVRCEYRIKPEPKPDVVRYVQAEYIIGDNSSWVNDPTEEIYKDDNIKLTFDGETGKLIKADVI